MNDLIGQNTNNCGKKSQLSGKRYKQLSIETKVRILKELDEGKEKKELALIHGVSRSSIVYLMKKRDQILDRFNTLTQQHGNLKNCKLRGSEDVRLEKRLYDWFCQKKSLGESISGPLLKEKALMFSEEINGPTSFIASAGWLSRFKKRHGIRSLSKKGKRSQLSGKRYKQLSIETKVRILKELEEGKERKELALRHGVSRASILYLMKKKDQILDRFNTLMHQHGNLKNCKLRGSEDMTLEKCLYHWFCQKKSLGEPISGSLLKEKALMFNEELNGPTTFNASDGWLLRFKKRHGIQSLSMKGETLSNDKLASEAFCKNLQDMITNDGYQLQNIFNADETGLAWKTLPTKAFAMRIEKDVSGCKLPEDRLTVLACTNATGSCKIPPLVIGKYENPHCFKNATQLPVMYKGQKSGWMDQKIFLEWYEDIFLQNIRNQPNYKGTKYLLILDKATCHPPVEYLNSIDPNCKVLYLPPNVTTLIQPMDQGVTAALKRGYRKHFLRRLLSKNHKTNDDITFLKKWTILDCCRALSISWNNITEAAIINAWKKILVQDTSVNTEISEIVQLTRLVSDNISTIDNSDVISWIKEDSSYPICQSLSDREIIRQYVNNEHIIETTELDQEEEPEESTSSTDPGEKEALDACEVLYRYFASRPDSRTEYFLQLDTFTDFVTNKCIGSKDA